MKLIDPDPLLRAAADALAPVRDDVVVIGASAIRVALHGREVPVSPTSDVDVGTTVEAAERVVAALEDAGLTRSPEAHERSFTWVRGDDLKVQLIRLFHPFPSRRPTGWGSMPRLGGYGVKPPCAHAAGPRRPGAPHAS